MDNRTALERFMCKVQVAQNGCWEWTAAVNWSGYGRFTLHNKTIPAHRFSYEQIYGPIAYSMVIDHLCRNRKCVNPEHLEAVTQSENLARSGATWYAKNKAKTHCVNGHAFDTINTQIQKTGRRRCRMCNKLRRRDYVKRKREENGLD